MKRLTFSEPSTVEILRGSPTYTPQGGHWSVIAKITVIVIGLCIGNMSVLYLVRNHWILERMKVIERGL